ncbi:Protein of unknown function [Pedobacter steynii]|uniref:DUF2004 domain-containing protein n=1 Tax=Pedobacter steynii TaxID=430522 RepID=A0A1G9KYT6_9SPHI|nr:DUF2004 domain-containing protein [Pedobacter steynii]NQX38680.1 DUF2004 domain-containing protein [Pedobacter steynii]SDL54901.1 Protein of unknown function [Pedobacter steynii]
MENFVFPHFGAINLSCLKDHYTVEIDVKGNAVKLDLFFDYNSIGRHYANVMKSFIEEIPSLDIQNQTYIEDDYRDSKWGTVKEYLAYHLKELDKDDLSELIDFDYKVVNPEKQLFSRLKLVAVTLHPDLKSALGFSAFFDYTVCKEFSDCVIVVNTDAFGKLDHLDWES